MCERYSSFVFNIRSSDTAGALCAAVDRTLSLINGDADRYRRSYLSWCGRHFRPISFKVYSTPASADGGRPHQEQQLGRRL